MSTEHEEFAAFTQSILASTPNEAPPPASVAEAPAKSENADNIEAVRISEDKPVVEPPKVEEKKPEVDWKELAAKEKERRAQKAASKLAQQQREREYTEAKAKADKLEKIMALSKDKRLSALSELGMTLDDVNSEYIRGLEQDPNKLTPAQEAAQKELAEIRAELKEFREEKARIKADSAARELKEQQTKIQSEYTAKAGEAIKAKPDDYELLGRHPQGKEVVFHLIAAHYAQTATFDDAGNVIVPGEELDVNEACSRAEAGLVEQLKPYAEAKKLRGTGKAQDSTTLAGDMRQPASRAEPAADDDKEFNNVALRLLKQHSA